MSNRYALLCSLAHSGVNLQCDNFHQQALHLMVVTSYSGVSKVVGQPRLKSPDQVCEESGVSLERLPCSFLKTKKRAVFETSPDRLVMPEVM